MDMAYGGRWIRRIGNCEYAFSCEDLALIRRIAFSWYGVLKFWYFHKLDLLEFVNIFFDANKMPLWSNSSFITLIPKVSNPTFIKDFCPISIIGIHYNLIAKILAKCLSKVIDKIIIHGQFAFISGRQILNPLMLIEVIDWYKTKKKKMLIFKVDYEKAFDFVSWKYLGFMLHGHGFGFKWMSSIKACLDSSRASVFANCSLTSEFSPKRGLRHGDPLSHFLLILIMEGLHVALSNTVTSCLIRSVKFGFLEMNLSHLFYDVDVVITTEWSTDDMENIIRVLQVFYLASGLKINIHKSNMHCIGVSMEEVYDMASNTDLGVRNSAYLRDTLNEISQIDIISDKDACVSSLANDGVFSVGATRMHINNLLLPSLDPTTTWDKTSPRKVNIYMRRLKLD
nr:RNA-directed DNA polymerase, eukaryota, reverse transcriptase zinc-binding domain protein [Tanacetum cinerariifolium]